VLTGAALAGIWSAALGRPVRYAGDDLDAFEAQFKAFMPGWMVYDMRQMLGRFQKDGMIARPADLDRVSQMLGRPLRSYRDLAAEAAKQWSAA
jgi:hypothetical protein